MTKHASARASAIARATPRWVVIPCWKIATGQPAVGLPGQAEVAFGIVTTIGTVTSATLAGSG